MLRVSSKKYKNKKPLKIGKKTLAVKYNSKRELEWPGPEQYQSETSSLTESDLSNDSLNFSLSPGPNKIEEQEKIPQ